MRARSPALTLSVCVAVLQLAALPALATPATLAPGASVAIPGYTGTGTPTITVLDDTGVQIDTVGGTTVEFQEIAARTSLDPGGVSFAFTITTSNNPGSLGATLPGYAGFTTAVESCDPFAIGTAGVCSSSMGTASRSGGSGATLTFASLGVTPLTVPGGPTLYLSNVYGIFTNAPGFTADSVTVMDGSSAFTFNGIAPAAAVPEPGTLLLMSIAVLALGLARRRRFSPRGAAASASSRSAGP